MKRAPMKHNDQFHSQLNKVSPSVKMEMDLSRAIIDRIDYILQRDGISRKELAERIGCKESQITRWTRGFPNYTISALAKLSVALGEPLINISAQEALALAQELSAKEQHEWTNEEIDQLIADYRHKKKKQ